MTALDTRPLLTWIERLQHDETLQAFVSAECARAGIELDTLRWQRGQDRQRIAALTHQLETAHAELRRLRRQCGRSRLIPGDAA